MARDHARIQIAIWTDEDFRALPVSAQHMYMLLLTQPTLSYCGVLDYVPRRLVSHSSDLTITRINKTVGLLETARFVAVDHEAAELLIRSYVRHDGVLEVPNVTKAVVRALGRVFSKSLRAMVIKELGRLLREEPDAKGWRVLKAEPYAELFEEVQAEGFGEGLWEG